MAQTDVFATQLWEEAKRFLEKSNEGFDPTAQGAYLHAALMIAFCALEAHINAVCEEFAGTPGLSSHEKGLLLEQDIKLEGGEFRLQSGLKMARLEERIEFLHAKFSGKPIDRTIAWWGQLSTAINLRNQLTHAKGVPAISEAAIRSAFQAILDALEALYRGIYRRKFPPIARGLQSRLTF